MATTRSSGPCLSGFMGYAVNYGVGDLAVFTSDPIATAVTVGGTLTPKVDSVDPAQTGWTGAQTPLIQVEVGALDSAGNYLEPVAAAQVDVCRTVNGAKVCDTGATPTAGVHTVQVPAIPNPAGSRLRTTIRAAQVVTSTARRVWGGTGSLGANFSDAGVTFTTGTLQLPTRAARPLLAALRRKLSASIRRPARRSGRRALRSWRSRVGALCADAARRLRPPAERATRSRPRAS